MDFDILDGKESLDEVEQEWNELWEQAHLQSLYLTHDLAYAQLHYSRFAPDKFFLVRARDNGRTVALCPFCLSRRGRIFPLVSLEILRTPQSPIRSCLVHRDYVEPAARELAVLISSRLPHRYQVITLCSVSPQDPFITCLEKELESLPHLRMRRELWPNVVVRVDPEMGSEHYFRSRKRRLRESVKRFVNRFCRETWWDVVVFGRPGPRLDQGLDHFQAVFSRAWQTQRDPDYHRQLAQRLAKKDMARLFILYCHHGLPVCKAEMPLQCYASDLTDDKPVTDGARPVAAMLCYRLGDRVHLVRTAFDREYGRYAPGKVLFWFCFKYFLDQGGVSVFDLEAGDEDYKRNWGEVNEHRYIFQVACSGSAQAACELWCEKNVVPSLRRVRRRLPLKRRVPTNCG